jgi:asparagine synthase (glutamine-hydrolysing)
MELDLRVYLVEDMLVKTDRASMAASLEARVPFLDPAVTELALAVPARHKVHWFGKKRLLRKALEPLLPSQILNGPKQGFSIPVAAWLRGELEPLARSILSPDALRRQGFFRPESVGAMLDDHVAGKQDLSRQLWNLLVFSLWHDRYVNGSGPA